MSKYNVGDKVRIINHRGEGWNREGLMDKYCGKVLTIMDVEEFDNGSSLYTMFECPTWAWENEDIAELVESATKTEVKPATPEFKVGMKVRIKGDHDDCTDHLDNEIGVIVKVGNDDCLVKVDAVPSVFGAWGVWKKNMTPVEEAETTELKVNDTNNTKEENDMNTTATENKKVALVDTPMEFNEDMATLIGEFTDNVLGLADKYNTDRRDTLCLVAKTITHTSDDDFFWDFIVPMNEIGKMMREKSRK